MTPAEKKIAKIAGGIGAVGLATALVIGGANIAANVAQGRQLADHEVRLDNIDGRLDNLEEIVIGGEENPEQGIVYRVGNLEDDQARINSALVDLAMAISNNTFTDEEMEVIRDLVAQVLDGASLMTPDQILQFERMNETLARQLAQQSAGTQVSSGTTTMTAGTTANTGNTAGNTGGGGSNSGQLEEALVNAIQIINNLTQQIARNQQDELSQTSTGSTQVTFEATGGDGHEPPADEPLGVIIDDNYMGTTFGDQGHQLMSISNTFGVNEWQHAVFNAFLNNSQVNINDPAHNAALHDIFGVLQSNPEDIRDAGQGDLQSRVYAAFRRSIFAIDATQFMLGAGFQTPALETPAGVHTIDDFQNNLNNQQGIPPTFHPETQQPGQGQPDNDNNGGELPVITGSNRLRTTPILSVGLRQTINADQDKGHPFGMFM